MIMTILDLLKNLNSYQEHDEIYISMTLPVTSSSPILVTQDSSISPSGYILAGLEVSEAQALFTLYTLLHYDIEQIAHFLSYYITHKVYFLENLSLEQSLPFLQWFKKDTDIICMKQPWQTDSDIVIYTGQYDHPTVLQQQIQESGYTYLLEVNLIISNILQAEYSSPISTYSNQEKAEMIIHYATYDTYADF
jgi:hypothetical protein